MRAGTVIVGTGQAGFQTAASLRSAGYLEPITLLGDEPHIPYQRPPLSKGFVLGGQDVESIELRPESFYTEHQIDLRTGAKVSRIDRAAHQVALQSGATVPYEKLVLAVGARNRRLPLPGADLDGVLYLRTLEESTAIKQRLAEVQNVVVVGGGFIGLELAAVARTLGKQVTVLEALPRLMARVVAPIISEFYRDFHESKGVTVLCGAAVAGIYGSASKAREVRMNDGTAHPADLILVGIGVAPNAELAQEAGLATANGIVVDEHLQTNDPDIYAIGDCADHPNAYAGCRVRLESVQNAADQASCVAGAIAGHPAPYKSLPWFWTDQYDLKLQMAGLSQGYDQIVTRGNAETRKLSVFYFKNGQLIAVDSMNRPADHMIGRKLIASAVQVTPEQAADESVDLKRLGQK